MATREQVSASEIETVISSLINVKSSRVVSEKGVIEEIHVLTDSSRAPKQVVRDIESAIMAQFGIELDHKKISVAQTQNGKRFRFVENRLRFYDVSVSLNGVRSEATVRLRKDDETFSGTATGPGTGHNQLRLVATATLRALEGCQGTDGMLMLEDLNPGIQLAGRQAVVVCISVITSRGDDYLTGSALVKQDLSKAVVNATLDAVNRRLGSLGEH
ncbi:MAG TPA: hypothetical protein VGK34_02505 [Armatimonadota bacterium]|jgi:predicted nucleic-acid-binding protein